jgi:hypothetical protein
VAPSYFIEGMLSNVPNDKFTGDYGDIWVELDRHGRRVEAHDGE